MDKTLTKVMKIMFSVVFIFLGIMMFLYIYSQPCLIEPIKVVQGGETVAETIFPKQLNLLMCIQGEVELLIMVLIAGSFVVLGLSYFFKNLLG